jgi:short-subunit dehydrogenase involved in D-alanine esterification of teichoic acids
MSEPMYEYMSGLSAVTTKSFPTYCAPAVGAKSIDSAAPLRYQAHQGGTTTDEVVVPRPASIGPASTRASSELADTKPIVEKDMATDARIAANEARIFQPNFEPFIKKPFKF